MAQVNQAIMFDPMKEREAKRQKALAELLVAKGNQPLKNEVAGGMTVARSPWEFANQAAEKYMGEYKLGEADKQQTEVDQQRARLFQEALGQLESNPQGAAGVLMQDPAMGPDALKLYQQALSDKREEDMMRERWAHEKELFGMKAASGGGSTPAAMQIANQMFALEQTMSNPNIPANERFLAERQYNLLGQAAKTYGFDRGIQAGPMSGYENIFAPQMGGGIQPVTMLPNGEMQAPMGGQAPNAPLNPMQYQDMMQQSQFNDLIGGLTGQQQDPVVAHAAAVQAQQAQAGVNPYQRAELKPAGMSPIQGYGDAVSQIAAQKKAAEGRASEVGKRQGENENLYRSMVSRMPQLEDTVERLSKLGQAATYTNSGQVRDFAMRELGMDVPDSATARAEYISMVNNEILPLLRDTFGAQFTEREGESLRATLGNPNASPQEKDAVLRSFMRTKMQTLDSARREIESGQSIPTYTPRNVTIGGQTYNPMGQNPQREQIAVNPQTGERLINRGNGWEPLQ